jgi:hypothetical protein
VFAFGREELDDEPGSPYEQQELAFLDKLRQHAQAWPTIGADSFSARFDDDPRTLVAVIRVRHQGFGPWGWAVSVLFVVGVHLTAEGVHGGMVHNQLYYVLEGWSGIDFGPIPLTDDAVDLVAAWFEGILRRPVERLDWLRPSMWPPTHEYQFADTKQGLGGTSGRGAGKPDRVILVRG